MNRAILATVALAFGAGCSEPAPVITGSISAEGGALGTWQLVPLTCLSGDAHEFNGVDLGDSSRAVRLVDDPSMGYVVVVAATGDLAKPTAVFHAADCAMLDAAVDHDGDDYDTVSGHLSVECPASAAVGTQLGGLHGAIEFAHCDAGYED